MRAGWGILLWLGLGIVSCAYAQELSTEVYPSEDELEQALTNNEISIVQFLELRELVRYGIDSGHVYLSDAIPNLLYSGKETTLLTPLEIEQFRPFRLPSFFRSDARVRWKVSYAHQVENDSLYRYYQSLQVRLTPYLSTDLRIAREYGSDAHLTGRSIIYQNPQGSVRKLIIGNYYARFGLGGVIGYRGQLLDAEESFTTESFLFPDYTGYNGALLEATVSGHTVQGLFSTQRDSTFSISTIATWVQLAQAKQAPVLVLSLNSLHNRETDMTKGVVTGSLFERYVYTSGRIAAEAIIQGENKLRLGGLLLSGEHKNDNVTVVYHGWIYDDQFHDFTSGGLSGSVRRATEFSSIGFSYTNRHRGQEGGTVRTAFPLNTNLRFLTNATVASLNQDTVDIQLLLGFTNTFSKQVTGRVDYLATQKIRTVGSESSQPVHQVRFETTLSLGRLVSRQYIVWRHNNSAGQLGILINPRYTLNDGSEIEVWVSSRGAALDETDDGYTYMFIRTGYHLFSQGILSLKFSHRFEQGNTESAQSTVTGTLELQW